jgi:hypothetical protein
MYFYIFVILHASAAFVKAEKKTSKFKINRSQPPPFPEAAESDGKSK